MSWDDREERRKAIRKWFGDFLPESMFEELEAMLDQIMSQMGQGTLIDPEVLREMMQNPGATNPFVFGFRMQVGPDGKPIMQRFGNVGPDEDLEAGPTLEPLVDLFEEENEIVIVVEVPGVDRDQIKVKIKGTMLTIHVDNPEKPYHKEIALPVKVVKENAASSLRNGVLEIRLRKA